MNQKTITISGVESTEKKVNLLDGKVKYNFWRTKKDGTQTKAEQQFQQFRFTSGDVIEAMVEEEPQTFVNDQGKTINFTDRKIAYFITQDKNTPQTSPTPLNPPTSHPSASGSDLEARVKALEDWKDKQPVWADIDGKQEKVPF
jgi:hypothetical protein